MSSFLTWRVLYNREITLEQTHLRQMQFAPDDQSARFCAHHSTKLTHFKLIVDVLVFSAISRHCCEVYSQSNDVLFRRSQAEVPTATAAGRNVPRHCWTFQEKGHYTCTFWWHKDQIVASFLRLYILFSFCSFFRFFSLFTLFPFSLALVHQYVRLFLHSFTYSYMHSFA